MSSISSRAKFWFGLPAALVALSRYSSMATVTDIWWQSVRKLPRARLR